MGNYTGAATTTFEITEAPVSGAEVPEITTDLSTEEVKYIVDGEATALTVEANSTDDGTLSYQWYSNTANSTTGGTVISGENSSIYTLSTTTAGTTYYYVVATNTLNGEEITQT